MVLESLANVDARNLFTSMQGLKILVLGDMMLDEWIWGTVNRISPEAPVPVVAVNNHSYTLGGAGNVAHNLRAIGASVSFAGAIGDDVEGDRVLRLLEDLGVDHELVIRLSDRPTTRKTRIVAHSQQVVRADWESALPLSSVDSSRLRDRLAARIAEYDAVVLSDYAKGLLSPELIAVALQAPITVADPKPRNLKLFQGVTCVAPNVLEAQMASGVVIHDDASLEIAGKNLLEQLKCEHVVITRGEKGMALFSRSGEQRLIPSIARKVYDVSGAGDTVVALLCLSLAAKVPIGTALELANVAAGAVVEKLGTATASPDEIMALIQEFIRA